jgi:hypothetical protein
VFQLPLTPCAQIPVCRGSLGKTVAEINQTMQTPLVFSALLIKRET